MLLPKDYDKHPDVRYPVNYSQGHFSTRAPGGFGSGGAFDTLWLAEDTPRFLYVTFQHPSPYYDDSYAVNSANNGPYGDAIMQELIPAVEEQFRVIREPWARMLSGGSTGGWEALAHQIFYPDFYGGTWASLPRLGGFPLPPDRQHLRRRQRVLHRPRLDEGRAAEPAQARRQHHVDDEGRELVRAGRRRPLALGRPVGHLGGDLRPGGADGYPKPIWDKRTGKIDKQVAAYWKEHYDLRAILERDWTTLGPKLVGQAQHLRRRQGLVLPEQRRSS